MCYTTKDRLDMSTHVWWSKIKHLSHLCMEKKHNRTYYVATKTTSILPISISCSFQFRPKIYMRTRRGTTHIPQLIGKILYNSFSTYTLFSLIFFSSISLTLSICVFFLIFSKFMDINNVNNNNNNHDHVPLSKNMQIYP